MALFDEVLLKSFQEIVIEAERAFFQEGLIEFQKQLIDGTNNLLAELQKRLLERVNAQFVSDKETRKGWVVERHGDHKTVLSPFGQVTYERTYFRHKKTGKYAYLVDQLAGYTPHQRLDALLEADIVKNAVDLSFRKAGRSTENRAKGTEVSGQTVLNLVRRLKPEVRIKEKELENKRACSVLYIEADEDHIASQVRDNKTPSNFQQKLVYVHEGLKSVGKNRNELINTKYFTFASGTKSFEIWEIIWRYIQNTYDIEYLDQIFVSGDGAAWIKAGVDYLPNSHFVLDGFHLQQSIQRAAGANTEWRKELTKAVWQGKNAEMRRILRKMYAETSSESHKKRIKEQYTYLTNNWNGIIAYQEWGGHLVRCSAEGHVSHILSARLSSRPMGWTQRGANQMAHLRVHQANGIDIRKMYLKAQMELEKRMLSDLPSNARKQLQKAVGSSYEVLDNIPILQGKQACWSSLLNRIKTSNIFAL